MTKKFLTNCLLFSIPFIIITIIVIIKLDNEIKNFNNPTIYKIDKTKNIIVLGDSHTECAINDSILENSINLSQSADAYIYSYSKLKKFISHNKQIDTLILSCSYHNFHKKRLSWYYENRYIQEKLYNYFFLMESSELSDIFKHNPIATLKAYFFIAKDFSNDSIFNLSKLKIGKYRNLNKFMSANEYQNPEKNTSICQKQIEYIRKIETLCVKNKIKLILISPPLHSSYNKDIQTNFKEILNTKLKNVPFLDYSDFQLLDSCFGDIEHLNYKGAKIFSEYLQKNGFKPLQKDTLSRK